MKNRNLGKKVRELFLLLIVVPLFFFLIIEGIIRLSGINTETVISKKFKIGIPIWAYDDVNFAIAGDILQHILDNELPVESAEWMKCFTEAKYVYYKLKPNVSSYVTNTVNRMELKKGIKVKINSNSLGFRTAETPFEKPENVYRIVFLGDSATFGWGVNQEERFSHYLEEKLNSPQQKILYEAINLGIPGYTTHHAVALFDHYALRYSPDMVVLTFGANDARKIPERVKKILKQPGWIEKSKNFLGNFKTYRLLRKFLLSIYNPFDSVNKNNNHKLVPFVTLKEFAQNLEYIIDKGEKRGISIVLLGLCCPIDYLAKMSAVGRRKGVVMMDGMYIMLKSIRSIQDGTNFTKLARHYQNLYGEEVLKDRRVLYVTSDTCHPNIIGHKIIAQALYEKLFRDPNKCNVVDPDH